MRKSLFLLSGIMVLGLTSCNTTVVVEYKPTNVITAMTQLAKQKNFTLEVKDTFYGDKGNIYFEENSYLNELYSNGYIKGSDGVYGITVDSSNQIRSGELLVDKDSKVVENIYDSSLFTTFESFDLTEVDSTNEVSIRSKSNRIAFLNLVGADVTNLLKIDTLVATFEPAESLLSFRLNYLTEENVEAKYIALDVKDVGTTSSKKVKTFVDKGGKEYVPSDEFKKVKTLFSGNNFTRNIYDNAGTTLVGTETFTDQYYYLGYDATLEPKNAAYYNKGYVSLVDKTYESKKVTNGIYMYRIREGAVFPYLGHTAADTTSTDIVWFMNYPSNLDLFNYFEYYDYNETDNVYFTDDYLLSYNMYNNFGIANAFDSSYTVQLIGSGFNYELNDDDKLSKVTFKVFMNVNGIYSYMGFEFTNFGGSKIALVDEFIAKGNVN